MNRGSCAGFTTVAFLFASNIASESNVEKGFEGWGASDMPLTLSG